MVRSIKWICVSLVVILIAIDPLAAEQKQGKVQFSQFTTADLRQLFEIRAQLDYPTTNTASIGRLKSFLPHFGAAIRTAENYYSDRETYLRHLEKEALPAAFDLWKAKIVADCREASSDCPWRWPWVLNP